VGTIMRAPLAGVHLQDFSENIRSNLHLLVNVERYALASDRLTGGGIPGCGFDFFF
jgi:hypothetical protein